MCKSTIPSMFIEHLHPSYPFVFYLHFYNNIYFIFLTIVFFIIYFTVFNYLNNEKYLFMVKPKFKKFEHMFIEIVFFILKIKWFNDVINFFIIYILSLLYVCPNNFICICDYLRLSHKQLIYYISFLIVQTHIKNITSTKKNRVN